LVPTYLPCGPCGWLRRNAVKEGSSTHAPPISASAWSHSAATAVHASSYMNTHTGGHPAA